MAYNIACEAPCDFGCVIAAEVLLSCGSESLEDVRREHVDDRERTYCEALLEVRREAFALVLNCESIFEGCWQ